ncbi:unnamed protein product [Heterobilharzia americana]|nr:unnamed protein product [Heterobilharzia americana]
MTLCMHLKAPYEVIYKTIEMFDRFVFLHFWSLPVEKCIESFDQPFVPQKKKIMLFLFTVLQVSTKLVYRHKILKTSDAGKIMQKLGYMFTRKEILSSELCVLGTLQDSLMCRTLEECVEFLGVVFRNQDRTVRFTMKNQVLFYVYCNYNRLSIKLRKYQLLFQSYTQTVFLLGFSILLSCLVLQNQIQKLESLQSVVKYLNIVNEQDIQKVSFIILTSI